MKEIILKGYHWPQLEFEKLNSNQIFYMALNYTSKCNYRCPYCFVGHDDLNSDIDELTLEEKKRIIKEGKLNGAKVLVIPGRGEPFMDKDFWDLLDYADLLNLWTVVYTNGHFLNRENIDKLTKSKISLYIKVDSFDENIYDELVGKTGAFAKFKENFDYLLSNFHKPEYSNGKVISRLGMNSVVTKQSVDSIEDIYRFCKKNDIYYTCRSPVKVGQANKTWDYLVGDEVEKLKSTGEKFSTRSFTSATPLGQCGIYKYGLTIENIGDIYVCPDAREGFEPIGNIKSMSMSDLIQIRNRKFPLNSDSNFCFVKSFRNIEEK